MHPYKSFYHFLHTSLDGLRTWGLVSVAVGLLAQFSRNTTVRSAGIQALVWGAIDAALAIFGQRDALKRIQNGGGGELERARQLRTVVLVNAALDVGYIAGGWVLARRKRPEKTPDEQAKRRGAGIGVLIQGTFLLIYDSILAWRIGRWVR